MKALLNGALGHMGQEVLKYSNNNNQNFKVVACVYKNIDINKETKNNAVPFFESLNNIDIDYDIIIDFSNHLATKELLEYAVKVKKPVVIATTGHSDEEKKLINEASTVIPIFFAANMSIGIAVLCQVAKRVANIYKTADIEIIEKHHNRKKDAPSGTALMLYESIKTVRENANKVCGRAGEKVREQDDIGIHAIRMGDIVGEHEVLIGTNSEVITLKHEAKSRQIFVEGAVVAGEFLLDKTQGLFNMYDIIKI